jgi:uncharacterized membrane protein
MTKYVVQCAIGLSLSIIGICTAKPENKLDPSILIMGIGIGISIVTCYQLLTDPIDTPE